MSKRILHIALTCFVLSACTKEKFDIHNLNNNSIYVQGHGGMGFSDLYPINSMVSILSCLNNGADGSEMDIQMTRDSVLILFHDEDLSVSTNLSGIVQNMDWDEVQKANYTNVPYGNYPIVRLDDFFKEYEEYPYKQFSLDIKLYAGNTPVDQYQQIFSEELTKIFHKYGLFENVRIESQSVEFLNTLKTENPDFLLYYYPQNFTDGLEVALTNEYTGLSISTDVITAEQVDLAHSYGIFVTIWGASTKKKNAEVIRKNPDMIQSDKVEHLVKLLQ